MRLRTRKYVALAVAVVVGAAYGRLSFGWSDFEFFAGEAALIVLIGGIGLPWMEYAPDGAWRRNPQP